MGERVLREWHLLMLTAAAAVEREFERPHDDVRFDGTGCWGRGSVDDGVMWGSSGPEGWRCQQ